MIGEKIKSLLQLDWLQPFRRTSIWLPSVLLPLFALGLWSYLEHPDWLEGTLEENASTGAALTTDPNSPVTEADLSLDKLSTLSEADTLSDVLQQIKLPQPRDENSQEQAEDRGAAASGKALPGAKAANPAEGKPAPQATNPFASAIQSFLNSGSAAEKSDPFKFSPIFPKAGATQAAMDESALQKALAELNARSAAELGQTETAPTLPGTEGSVSPTGATPIRRGEALPGAQVQNSPVGQGIYIPGQMPSNLPGQSLGLPDSSGFVTPNPGSQVYYPSQRGTGGYQVTPGGTTYSRQRGQTGAVVTPQGIVGPRERGSTGSVVTPEGTVYTRERGSTGFTPPPVNPTIPANPTANPFQANPFDNSTGNGRATAP